MQPPGQCAWLIFQGTMNLRLFLRCEQKKEEEDKLWTVEALAAKLGSL